MNKYVVSLFLLITILIGIAPITVISQDNRGSSHIYAKYEYTMDISINNTSRIRISAEFIILLNITGSTIYGEVRLIRGTSYISSTNAPSPTTTTITPSESEASYKFTIPIDNYYTGLRNEIGRSTISTPQLGTFNPGSLVGPSLYGVEKLEATDYNGYPAIHETINIEFSQLGINYTITGDIYLHEAYLLPLYVHLNVKISGDGYGKPFTGEGVVELKLLEGNIPRETSHAEINVNGVKIVVGGFPGAKIVVAGRKGSRFINVTNKGDQPGYVMIYRGGYSLAPISQDMKQNVELVQVAPGETKRINVGVQLPDNIEESTSLRSGGSFLSSPEILVLTLIVIGLLAVLGLIVYKAMHPGKTVEATTISEEPGTEEEAPIGSGTV